MAAATPLKSRPSMGSSSSAHRSKRSLPTHFHRMSKVVEIDESQCEEWEGDHPDQVSTSGSENSDSSKNSQPPLLDFIGTACIASTWFTSCFPCAVVDINHCDDQVVSKLNRSNAMSVMYGVQEEPQAVRVPNSFELSPGETDDDGKAYHHPQQQEEEDYDDDLDSQVNRLAAELESQDDVNAPPSPGAKEHPSKVHEDTPAQSPTRKRFNIRPLKPSVKKLFKRKHQQ